MCIQYIGVRVYFQLGDLKIWAGCSSLNVILVNKGGGGNAASLLSTKVADCMLAHSKKKIESIYTSAPLSKLSNEEKA